jgi:Spy/CpxP family protein refolding chaperone
VKKTTSWIVTVVVIAGLSLTSLAWAQPGKGGCEGCDDHQGKGGMMGLGLTEEQHKQFDEMKIKHLKEVMPLKTDLQIKQMELGALWRADELDSKKIIAKVKEISGVREKLQIANVEHRLNMYKVLTPEQRKQARRFVMGRRGMGRMFGRGHRAGKGGMRGQGRRGMGHPGPQMEAPPGPPPAPEGE